MSVSLDVLACIQCGDYISRDGNYEPSGWLHFEVEGRSECHDAWVCSWDCLRDFAGDQVEI